MEWHDRPWANQITQLGSSIVHVWRKSRWAQALRPYGDGIADRIIENDR